jgi:hypothetical protein
MAAGIARAGLMQAMNAPNHTQWNSVNPIATFNTAGQITNLPAFDLECDQASRGAAF